LGVGGVPTGGRVLGVVGFGGSAGGGGGRGGGGRKGREKVSHRATEAGEKERGGSSGYLGKSSVTGKSKGEKKLSCQGGGRFRPGGRIIE